MENMMRIAPKSHYFLAAAAIIFGLSTAQSDDFEKPERKNGYDVLLSKPMSGGQFKIADLDRLYLVWEGEAKEKADKATPEERHRMIFDRYGFIPRATDKT